MLTLPGCGIEAQLLPALNLRVLAAHCDYVHCSRGRWPGRRELAWHMTLRRGLFLGAFQLRHEDHPVGDGLAAELLSGDCGLSTVE